MIDNGVYPTRYRLADGSRPPRPQNMEEICNKLSQPRPSLSPSAFSETVFEEFQDSNEQAQSESKATANVIPYITGSKDRQYATAGDVKFTNLAKFDPSITILQPDGYYGANPAQIDPRVRSDLNEYIIPSSDTSLPAAGNYFREDKSAKGRADVAQSQAMHAGAVGARGIFHLQNYGNATPVHDGNAYTIASTYHPGTGTLQMYATHPAPPARRGGEPQYYMNQLGAYAMTHAPETFRAGASAYRNAGEWTQQQRDRFIANANAVAQRRSTETRSFSTTVSSATAEGSSSSETSADELALDYDTAAKRRRRPMSSR